MTIIDELKKIPKYEPKPIVKKRYVQMPKIDDLIGKQVEAFKMMQEFSQSLGGGLFLLEGYAGTGKTYLTSKFIEWYLAASRTMNVAVTAPTNKAVKVLREAAEYEHTNLNFSTIHKLLGLREVIDQWGNQKFDPDPTTPSAIESMNLLVIDETSMLSDELFDMIYPFVKQNNLKVLFVGDPAQIPPVGRNECIPFDAEWQLKLSIGKVTLTDIIRQQAGNPIIDLSMQIRENIGVPTAVKTRESITTEQGNILYLTKGDPKNSEILEDLIEAWFVTDNFKNNADFAKVIAWRNKVVDFMNDFIRRMLFGQEISKIVVGEKLIANKPIIIDEAIVFTANDEFEVTGFTLGSESINDGDFAIKYYLAEVKYINPADGYETGKVIKIVHEESQHTYDFILEKLVEVAKSVEKGYASKKAWENVYQFKELFADVKYNYAITAHKSQGSTYDNVIVLEHDLDNNKKVRERNRIKYTAFTRPRKNLVVVK